MKKFLFILISLLFLSCSNDSTLIEPQLVGTWENQCHTSTDWTAYQTLIDHYEILKDGTIYYEEYTFDDEDPFEDSFCDGDFYITKHYDGKLSIGDTVTTKTGEKATILYITICSDEEVCHTDETIFIIENDTLIFGSDYGAEYVLYPEDVYYRID